MQHAVYRFCIPHESPFKACHDAILMLFTFLRSHAPIVLVLKKYFYRIHLASHRAEQGRRRMNVDVAPLTIGHISLPFQTNT